MENLRVLIIVLGVTFGIFAAVWLLLPYLIKRGVNVQGALQTAGAGVSTANQIVDALQALLPGNIYLNVADRITDYAMQAVEYAEQLYKTQEIPAEQRKVVATDHVYDILRLVGIEITPEIKRIVDGSIEAGVYVLPKTHQEDEAE